MLYIKEYSDIFHKEYDSEDTIIIVNTKQAGLYVKHHVPLVDLFWSNGNLVFVFNKEKSKQAYELWKNHQLT